MCVCVGVRLRWAEAYISAFEWNACSDFFGLYCLAGCMIRGLRRGPDFYLLPLTVHPTPITRCMLFWARSTMMHSLLHTHLHSNTHTSMKTSLHFNNNHTHGSFLPCKHVVLLFSTDKVLLNRCFSLAQILCPNLVFLSFNLSKVRRIFLNLGLDKYRYFNTTTFKLVLNYFPGY